MQRPPVPCHVKAVESYVLEYELGWSKCVDALNASIEKIRDISSYYSLPPITSSSSSETGSSKSDSYGRKSSKSSIKSLKKKAPEEKQVFPFEHNPIKFHSCDVTEPLTDDDSHMNHGTYCCVII